VNAYGQVLIVLGWAGLGWAGLGWAGLSESERRLTLSHDRRPDCSAVMLCAIFVSN